MFCILLRVIFQCFTYVFGPHKTFPVPSEPLSTMSKTDANFYVGLLINVLCLNDLLYVVESSDYWVDLNELFKFLKKQP